MGESSAGKYPRTILDANGLLLILIPISQSIRSGNGQRAHALVKVPVVLFFAAYYKIGKHPGLREVGHVGGLTSIVLAGSILSFPVRVVQSLSVGAKNLCP